MTSIPIGSAPRREIAEDFNRTTGAGFAFESHLERRPALEGAQFVVNEIQVGGLDGDAA